MKYSLTFVAVVWGYLVACIFLFMFALINGNQVSQFWIEMLWTGFYGLPLGFLTFVFFFRFVSSSSAFWRFYLAPFFGGAIGWSTLMLLFRELGMSIPYGGFAFVMGFTTFLLGAVFHNQHRRSRTMGITGHNTAAQTTASPSSGL